MARKTKEEAEKTRKDLIAAARTVFHECGVSRSTLEKIAKEAGVTRGALYWHFKDKAALFSAMREDVFTPLVERSDSILFSESYENPLNAIEASLISFWLARVSGNANFASASLSVARASRAFCLREAFILFYMVHGIKKPLSALPSMTNCHVEQSETGVFTS